MALRIQQPNKCEICGSRKDPKAVVKKDAIYDLCIDHRRKFKNRSFTKEECRKILKILIIIQRHSILEKKIEELKALAI